MCGEVGQSGEVGARRGALFAMMPNATKGSDIRKLMWYLASEGRHNEHTNPRVIAGDFLTMAIYGGPIDKKRAWELGKLLDSPRQTLLRGAPVLTTSYKKARQLMADGVSHKDAYEQATSDENTWHCSLALRADEGELPMEKWAAIAEDFMKEMGFIGRDGAPDARWATVHHGLSGDPNSGKPRNDHIHIAMPIILPDGSKADMYRDRPRAQAAARVLEKRYGLEVLYTRQRGDTEQATKPAERARAERVGAPETEREALRRRVRGAAVAADSEAEWLRLLHAEGVTVVPRWAPGGTDEVEGYSVQLPPLKNPATGKLEGGIRYGGLRLGRDLSLPNLRRWAPWDQSPAAQRDALEEWRRTTRGANGRPRAVDPMAQQDAIRELREWSDAMRRIPVEDRDAWAQAASQTAGAFAAVSVRVERKPGRLDRLSRQLARTGQMPAHRRSPRPARDTRALGVARMLWMLNDPRNANLALIYAMTDLLRAVREMLDARGQLAASRAMAAEARHALRDIHLRAEGINPAKPYDMQPGSPGWAADLRARAVVEGDDLTETEELIRVRRALASEKGDRTRRILGRFTPPEPGRPSPGRGSQQFPQRPPPGYEPPGRDRGRGHGR
ncbi:relaxase/mobilization nuclease domain-containing protein [Nocardia wallacei]|uniref:relaxase/mobilization nuclease domain-containing protein n=1 Tax=Nocardia wallacei TaxID=480035 RepID=UPI003CC7D456